MSTTKMFVAGVAVAFCILRPEIPASLARAVANGFDNQTAQQKTDSNKDVILAIQSSQVEAGKISAAMLTILDKILGKLDSTVSNKQAPVEEIISGKETVVEPASTKFVISDSDGDQHAKLEQQYRNELQRVEILEAHEKYHGNDPIVRKRLGLPPKLPSFDEYASQHSMNVKQFDKAFAAKFSE